jgi:hypothetical protein
VTAITGPDAGHEVEVFKRMPVRFSISSEITRAAVLSAGGSDPGRTTIVALLRSTASV